MPGQPIAAFYPVHFPHGHIGGRNQSGVIAAPDIPLRAVIEQGQLPVVNCDDTQHPGSRHTGLCKGHLYLEEHCGVEFKATVASRLHNTKKASLLHGGYCRFR